jgi:hypothetical protein
MMHVGSETQAGLAAPEASLLPGHKTGESSLIEDASMQILLDLSRMMEPESNKSCINGSPLIN